MKVLEDFRNEIITCGHCRACTIYNYHTLEKWIPCCPSGEKFGWESYYCVGRIEMARAMMENELENSERLQNIVFSCATCGACAATCRMYKGMDTVAVIEALRYEMVKREWIPPRHVALRNDIKQFKNPYGEANEQRFTWAPKEVKNNGANVAYFVGCTSAIREKELGEKTVEVMKKLNGNFTILDGEEWCCGSPLLRTGHRELAGEYAHHNIEALEKAKIDTVIFSCAGCYRTFRIDYPEIMGKKNPFKLYHVTEYLNQLLKDGKLKFTKPLNMTITYHDPCHLGRHIVEKGTEKGLYAQPRAILAAIPGLQLKEMTRNKGESWCCGAGGGVKATYGDVAVETAKNRLDEAVGTGAQAIVSTCPFCRKNLKDAAEKFGMKIEVYDLIELVAKAL